MEKKGEKRGSWFVFIIYKCIFISHFITVFLSHHVYFNLFGYPVYPVSPQININFKLYLYITSINGIKNKN